MTDLSDDEADVKLYTTKKVAELCEVTTETVRNWIKSGDLRAVNLNGFWRVPHADLKSFLNERHGGNDAQA